MNTLQDLAEMSDEEFKKLEDLKKEIDVKMLTANEEEKGALLYTIQIKGLHMLELAETMKDLKNGKSYDIFGWNKG